MRLILEEVLDNGVKPVAAIDGHSHRIGRDLTTDIAFGSSALSRQHGVFQPFVTGWTYKDLGSTNGSWRNGEKLQPHRFVPLKEGDFLQLANIIIKIRYEGERVGDVSARLFVLKDAEPIGEYSLANAGGTIRFGGTGSQFSVMGYHDEEPALAFTSAPGRHSLVINPTTTAYINGERAYGAVELKRGAHITLGEYEIVLVEGPLARPKVEARRAPVIKTPQVDLTATPGRQDDPEPRESGEVFSSTHTVAISPERARTLRFGEAAGQQEEEDDWATRPQQRAFGTIRHSSGSLFDLDSMSDGERRLVYGIFLFLALSVLLFIFWFFV